QDGRTAPEEVFPFGDLDIYGTMATSVMTVSNTNGFLISGQGQEVPPVDDLGFAMSFLRKSGEGSGWLSVEYYTLDGPEDGFFLLPAMRVEGNSSGQFYGTDGPGVRQATRFDQQTGQVA